MLRLLDSPLHFYASFSKLIQKSLHWGSKQKKWKVYTLDQFLEPSTFNSNTAIIKQGIFLTSSKFNDTAQNLMKEINILKANGDSIFPDKLLYHHFGYYSRINDSIILDLDSSDDNSIFAGIHMARYNKLLTAQENELITFLHNKEEYGS